MRDHWLLWVVIAGVYALLFGAPRYGVWVILGVAYVILGAGLAYLVVWCLLNGMSKGSFRSQG